MPRVRISQANINTGLALTALVFSLTGAAYASGLIGTSQLANGAVTAPKLATGAVITAKVHAEAITDAKLTTIVRQRLPKARAYGRIAPDGALFAGSRNIVSVANPHDGLFCVYLPAWISATTATPVVSAEFSQSADSALWAYPNTFEGPSTCNALGNHNGVAVVTGMFTNNGGAADSQIGTATKNEGFNIVVG